MSEICDTPSPYKSYKTSQLNDNFNSLYLRNETRYRQSIKCVDNYKGSPTSSQNVMSTNGFKLDLHFYPSCVNSASFPGFADGDQQRKLG